MQAHLSFFDHGNGVVYPIDTFRGFHAIGFNVVCDISTVHRNLRLLESHHSFCRSMHVDTGPASVTASHMTFSNPMQVLSIIAVLFVHGSFSYFTLESW